MPLLTYAGVPLLFDIDKQLADFLDRNQRLDELVLNGEPAHKAGWQGNPTSNSTNIGLPTINWPQGPAPKINQLYWPCTGASRWAEGLFICTGEQKKLIDTCFNASNGAELTWWVGQTPIMDSLEADSTAGSRTGERAVYWRMWPLAFRRIAGCNHDTELDPDGILDHDDDYDLYVVHLVDKRYWWQFVDAPDICQYTGNWADLIGYLCTQLGIAQLWHANDSPLPTAYTSAGPHKSEFDRPSYNAALLLDAALESIGARLVAGLEYQFELHRASGSEGTFLVNISSSQTGLTNIDQQIAGTECLNALTRYLPTYVNVAFPKSRFGLLCGQCNEGANSTEDDCHEEYLIYTHAMSEFLPASHCTVQSTVKTIHVRGWADMGVCEDSSPMNETELAALAYQIAYDWYMYRRRQYDITTASPYWDPCGYDDCLIYKFGIEYDDEIVVKGVSKDQHTGMNAIVDAKVITKLRRDISVRLQSLPLNVGSDCQLHNTNALELAGNMIAKTPTGGIAAPSGDTITGVLCVAYRLKGDLACGTLTREKITAIDSVHSGDDYQIMVYHAIGSEDVQENVYIDTIPFRCCARRVVVEECETGGTE